MTAFEKGHYKKPDYDLLYKKQQLYYYGLWYWKIIKNNI